jgi:hypothetical protein
MIMRILPFIHVAHGSFRMPFRVQMAAPLALFLAACISFEVTVPHVLTE